MLAMFGSAARLWESLVRGLSAPQFPERRLTRSAQVTNLLSMAIFVMGVIYLSLAVTVPSLRLRADAMVVGFIGSYLLPLTLIRTGHVHLGGTVALGLFWLTGTALAMTNGGVTAPASSFYLVLVLTAGLMSAGRAVFIVTALCFLSLLALVYLKKRGILLSPVLTPTDTSRMVSLSMLLVWILIMTRTTLRQLDEALTGAERENEGRRKTEAELRSTEAELRKLNLELEARVASRTSELAAAKDEALSGSRAKSEFLATMSHELRTPIAGIVGLSDLLEKTSLSAEQRTLLTTLKTSTQTLMALLNDVLDYSKIEAGQVELERIDFELRERVRAVVELLRPQAEKKQLALTLEIEKAAPRYVNSDPTRLQQVLFNLIGNSIKFTESGEVRVTVTAGPEATLDFTVRDTGIGMSEATQARLFRPFTQADASTTRRYGGTGLGLAISQRFVALLGGRISVSSQLGEGSSFTFRIPAPAVYSPSLPDALEAEPVPPAATPLRVLLAEDNEVNALVVASMLRRLGHVCERVGDGEQAVRRAESESFDVVIMDMQMPVLDGAEATRRIRALPGSAGRVPIIALTADAISQHRDRYLESGLSAFLTKPCTVKQLAKVLAAATPNRAAP